MPLGSLVCGGNVLVTRNCANLRWDGTSLVIRDGLVKATGSALTNPADRLHPHDASYLLAGCDTRLEALNTSYSVAASATGLTTSVDPWAFATVGSPSGTTTYCSNGANTARKWNGSAWSSPTCTVDGVAGKVMPKGRCYGLLPQSNRLAVASFQGTTDGPNSGASSGHHVYFSAAGDPETWTSTNYVQLTPGDGENITAMARWRDMLFVFKRTKFFVFGTPSTDATGAAVFNYREVASGVGAYSQGAVCAAADAVYFACPQGMYRTTGGDPVRVSDDVAPLFDQTTDNNLPTITGIPGTAVIDWTTIYLTMFAAYGRVHVVYSDASGNGRVLVYQPGWGWAHWSYPPSSGTLSLRGACSWSGVTYPMQIASKYSTTYHVCSLQPSASDSNLGSGASSTVSGGVIVPYVPPSNQRVRAIEFRAQGQSCSAAVGVQDPGSSFMSASGTLTVTGYPVITRANVNARGMAFKAYVKLVGDGAHALRLFWWRLLVATSSREASAGKVPVPPE